VYPILPHNLCLLGRNSLLNRSLQRGRVSADNLADLLSVLEDDECRHGADAKLLRNIGDFVNVDLNEVCGWELV
jgi:hypothetical protein